MGNSMPNFLTMVAEMYNQQPNIRKMGFLTSFFKAQPDSFTDVNKINLDMVYGGEDIAPVVRDLSTGAVVITQDEFGNMEIPFPVYALDILQKSFRGRESVRVDFISGFIPYALADVGVSRRYNVHIVSPI